MKNANIFALAAGMSSMVLATAATAGLSVDLVNSGDQGNTYRVYIEVDAGSRIDAIYGNSQGELRMGTVSGASFYQNANGGHSSKQINSNFFPFVPSMEWDSYVTIGALYQNGAPFGANNLNDIGIDWSGFESGGALTTTNGSWFVTPDDAQGGEIDGRVLIAQLTIAGDASDLDLLVNAQGKDADGNTMNMIGLAVPAPGALALLGVAGLVSRRRRK